MSPTVTIQEGRSTRQRPSPRPTGAHLPLLLSICLTAVALAAGCSGSGDEENGPIETGDPVLLIEGEQAEAGGLWMMGVSVDDEGPAPIGSTYEFEPATLADFYGNDFEAPSAHDGHGAFVTIETEGDQNLLLQRRVEDHDDVEVAGLEDLQPVAVHLFGRAVFAGSYGEVGWFDLDDDPAGYEQLVLRSDMQHKPYDLFAREGKRLVAIDNIVEPVFADYFELDSRGKPDSHLADWVLPEFVYGSYKHALLAPGEGDDPVLYTVTNFFSGYVGGGQALVSIPIEGTSLGEASTRTEYMGDEYEMDQSLLAGDEYTAFTGLAWQTEEGERAAALLVAAGERGMLVMPKELAEEPAPRLIDVGGPCLDVAFVDGRVYALVGGEEPGVQRLDPSGDDFTMGPKLELEGAGRRFVR